jgi:hypothetical protein
MDSLLPNMSTKVTGSNVHQGTQLVTASTPSPSVPTTSTPASASSSSKRKLLEFDTSGQSGVISGQSGTSGMSGLSGPSGQSGQSSAAKRQKNKPNTVASAVGDLTTVYQAIGGKLDQQRPQYDATVRLERFKKRNTWLTMAQSFELLKMFERNSSMALVFVGTTEGSDMERTWVQGHLGLEI